MQIFQIPLPPTPTLPKIKYLKMTCSACPSQWEGRTEDGEPVYVRYRWGILECAKGVGGPDWLPAKEVGPPLSGFMDRDEMEEYLSGVFRFPNHRM